MHYSREELERRIKSIEFVLALPPDKISINEDFRKDTEARLQELKEELSNRQTETPSLK